ncbi:MAG: PadR family transcriptional regulator [Geodermatophilaceae bacterium]|nr:PadR family transcriptional regulator [Geodermatophilaceae bacterium]
MLSLVAEQPRHGYEIIQEIGERSGGRWHPSPGSIYPTVAQLEDEGLVSSEKVEGRRMVQLTEAGTSYVAEHREELDAVWAKASEDPDEPTADLRAEMHQLGAAVRQIAGIGTPEQLQTVAGLLAETRKGIYRLLAE